MKVHCGKGARSRSSGATVTSLTVLGPALVAAALPNGAARAQQSDQSQALEEVVVTGSRIARRDFEANSPITTVDQALINDTMSVGIEKVMNQLPQFVPAVTQFVTTDVQSTATNTPGASTLSLRGLGANRNLVLIDGRRPMPVNASGAVDVNTIPSAAIERVETITGGASSVYGADAMAGVVNFIMKRNFEGVNFDARYGTTEQGGGGELRFTGLYGANFSDNKGNVLMGFEYDSRGKVLQSDRAFYRDGWADPTTGASLFGIAEPFYQVQRGKVDPNGRIDNPPNPAVVAAAFPGAARPISAIPGQNFYWNYGDSTLYKGTADGSYNYQGPLTVDGLQYREIRADGSPGSPAAGTIVQNEIEGLASIPFTRYAVFGRSHLELGEHLEAVMQANFSEDETRTLLGDNWALSFWGAPVPHGDRTYTPSVDPNGNTYATYQAGGAFGLSCPPVGGCTVSQAWPTPPALTAILDSRPDREADWFLGDTTTYLGKRTSDDTNTTYQLLVGLEGSFPNRDWTWAAYASHGATNVNSTFGGFLSTERYRYLVAQPNYGRGASAIGNQYGGRVSGILNCTTGLPIMQDFTPSQDCIDGMIANLQNQSKMQQNVAEFDLQGKLVDMPAGEARFALGSDYRKNTYAYSTDILASQQSFLDGVIGLFPASNSDGETSVRELYGELLLPLLSGKKAAQNLGLELGYRYSDNDPSGAVDTYKALLDWSPASKVRFRGGHQVANRAPNIGELFLSKTQTVTFNPFGDPCSTNNTAAGFISANPAANPNAAAVRAICEQQMGPVGTVAYYGDPSAQLPGGGLALANTIGNPNLEHETAKTDTFGVVLQLEDRASLSIDYWDIAIDHLISAESVVSVFIECFSPAFNPAFDAAAPGCRRLTRDTNTGAFNAADVSYTNDAAIETSGVDVQFNWGTDLGQGNLQLSFLATYLDSMKTRLSPTSAWVEYKGTFGPTIPSVNGGAFDYRTFTTVSYFNGNWNLSLRWNHLPSIEAAAAATGPTSTLPTSAYDLFNLTGGFNFNRKWQLRFGIDNLFDTEPEIVDATPWSAGSATNGNFYDVLGRAAYVGLGMQF
ncbi:MAG TPA: TonB-dependent receptor [Gammaproteobacteria bacterium]|nr:TonB-dependent receptor [Gammaproteobacteria bacterium]